MFLAITKNFKKKCEIQKLILSCCHNYTTFRSYEETGVHKWSIIFYFTSFQKWLLIPI